MADTLLRFDANNGERGEALRRVLASEGAQADLSDLLDVQRYETFAPSAAGSSDGEFITVTAPEPGTLDYALYASQNAFQSVGGLSADDAYAAVGVLADNISSARASTSGVSPAFLSGEVDSFMMGAGDTATWVAQEIGNRPLLRWSLEAVSIASGPAHYAIGKVLEPVTEPAMGHITQAANDRFSSTGHSDPDSGRGATGVVAVGSLILGASATKALEMFGRFRFSVDPNAVGSFGGNVRIRPHPINLPSWRRIGIDMDHIAPRHMPGGALTGGRDVFPEWMSARGASRDIRQAYRYGQRVRSQGDNVLVRGPSAAMPGRQIEMWVNTRTRQIETAYPFDPD